MKSSSLFNFVNRNWMVCQVVLVIALVSGAYLAAHAQDAPKPAPPAPTTKSLDAAQQLVITKMQVKFKDLQRTFEAGQQAQGQILAMQADYNSKQSEYCGKDGKLDLSGGDKHDDWQCVITAPAPATATAVPAKK